MLENLISAQIKFCFMSFTSINSYTLFQAIILWKLKFNVQFAMWTKHEKMAKNLISDPILARLVDIWASKTFLVSFTSTRYVGHCRKL